MKVVSIKAHQPQPHSKWEWEDFVEVGDIKELPVGNKGERISPRRIFNALREIDIEIPKGNMTIEDQGNQLVIVNRHNRKPLFAIEMEKP